MEKHKYYVYFIPRTKKKGITDNWKECEKIIHGEINSRFKGFKTLKEAEEWLKAGAVYGFKKKLEPGIYFDSGTGRGIGVEISVTDEIGNNLLSDKKFKKHLDKVGHFILQDVTNNYGELLACYHALKIAGKEEIKRVFGDSKLVINYWSKGYMNKNKLPLKTKRLIKSVARLRKIFEENSGAMEYISGDDNPADLGFHRR
ncbi:MAG: ribonuclease H family protein [Candidatus Azambacteria bacterium]|nr:ribonuclease H family protein [Candidatus Azambacteria bacterium]